MNAHSALRLLFGSILAAMLLVTGSASVSQPVWEWGGLVRQPDRAWTVATVADAYAGFLTFYAWVYYKERWPGRLVWFALIMLLGNIATASYMLRELKRLRPGEPVALLLTRTAR